MLRTVPKVSKYIVIGVFSRKTLGALAFPNPVVRSTRLQGDKHTHSQSPTVNTPCALTSYPPTLIRPDNQAYTNPSAHNPTLSCGLITHPSTRHHEARRLSPQCLELVNHPYIPYPLSRFQKAQTLTIMAITASSSPSPQSSFSPSSAACSMYAPFSPHRCHPLQTKL